MGNDMIDIQDHIRNRGALNLFDGKGVKSADGHAWDVCSEVCKKCGMSWISVMQGGSAVCSGQLVKPNAFTERQTIVLTEGD